MKGFRGTTISCPQEAFVAFFYMAFDFTGTIPQCFLLFSIPFATVLSASDGQTPKSVPYRLLSTIDHP